MILTVTCRVCTKNQESPELKILSVPILRRFQDSFMIVKSFRNYHRITA